MASSLSDRLAQALPKAVRLRIHHFSALPASTEPLFVPPPHERPEPTEVESHFFSASIRHGTSLIQVFALEFLVYTTSTLTTLFVSKADSTGYLHLLGLAPGTPSPIQAAIIAFIQYLIEDKRRAESRLVLSLFARAQDQYLFPGSIENDKKHVLDDRGLIKWWAKIIDRVLPPLEISQRGSDPPKLHDPNASSFSAHGYIVVPGCDLHETKTFIPRGADFKPSTRWRISDPLSFLGKPGGIPERCLIPRFPDDPKARFAIDLDDELPEASEKGPENNVATSNNGRWRSVKSLAQFWELMSFRQECSAGRLVGFLWAVWEPAELQQKPHQATLDGRAEAVADDEASRDASVMDGAAIETSAVLLPAPEGTISASASLQLPTDAGGSGGPQPQVQSPLQTQSSGNPEAAPPPVDAVDGNRIPPLIKHNPAESTLTSDAYARCMALLLTLDFCDLEAATESTRRFLSAVGEEGGRTDWGKDVTGQLKVEQPSRKVEAGEVNSLQGLVRKRPKTEEPNVLGAGLIRKKPKA